jgi:hypothetical protein
MLIIFVEWWPAGISKSKQRAFVLGKPIGDARGTNVGPDGVAQFDRSGLIRPVAGAHGGGTY